MVQMKINLSVAAVLLSLTFTAPVAQAARVDAQPAQPAKSSTVERQADLNAGVWIEEWLLCMKETHGSGLTAIGQCMGLVADSNRNVSSDKR